MQVTGQGGYLLWMMPENAAFARRYDVRTCLQNAKVYLADVGFGEMEPCFVQQYDGMAVANFAAVQDGVTLYSDQVKVQVSMDSGRVVGAECSQYLANHTRRTDVTPTVTAARAREMVSPKLTIRSERLCVIPLEAGEALCEKRKAHFKSKIALLLSMLGDDAPEFVRLLGRMFEITSSDAFGQGECIEEDQEGFNG